MAGLLVNNYSQRNPPTLGEAFTGLLGNWGDNIESGLLTAFPYLAENDPYKIGQGLLRDGVGVGSIAGVKAKTLNPHYRDIKQPNGNDKSYVSWDIENDPIFDEDGFESAGEDYALIEKIYVPEADRSNGVGRRILRESIHEIQQQHPDMPIKIAAYPFGDNALDMEDLVNFYKSEGFDVVNTDGHAVIMEHDGSIVAKPNKAGQELLRSGIGIGMGLLGSSVNQDKGNI